MHILLLIWVLNHLELLFRLGPIFVCMNCLGRFDTYLGEHLVRLFIFEGNSVTLVKFTENITKGLLVSAGLFVLVTVLFADLLSELECLLCKVLVLVLMFVLMLLLLLVLFLVLYQVLFLVLFFVLFLMLILYFLLLMLNFLFDFLLMLYGLFIVLC